MRKRRRSVVAFIAILLCICTSVHATVLHIQDVTLSLGIPISPLTFYTYASGSGSLNLPNVTVGQLTLDLAEIPGGTGGYSISGVKATISSSLIEDTSLDGLASGNFQGGGQLVVTGTLRHDGTAITSANTRLIVANMAISSSETWALGELAGTPITLDGSIQFLPTAEGLGLGIVHGSDTLKIDNFRADFTFMFVGPDPSVLNTDQSLAGTGSTIQIVAMAPEPATVFLFTMAALAFRINKKK
ncbi:MAG: hypothetical protein ABR969_01930 [Sedimentisphaerales bacterium]